MTDNRQSGVNFGDLLSDLETEDYPLSTNELLETYGERELTYANGSTLLRELVEPMGDVTYNSADEVRESMLSMVGDEAEGRKDYTDREPGARGEDFEQQSF